LRGISSADVHAALASIEGVSARVIALHWGRAAVIMDYGEPDLLKIVRAVHQLDALRGSSIETTTEVPSVDAEAVARAVSAWVVCKVFDAEFEHAAAIRSVSVKIDFSPDIDLVHVRVLIAADTEREAAELAAGVPADCVVYQFGDIGVVSSAHYRISSL
jgi:hypothetical protein